MDPPQTHESQIAPDDMALVNLEESALIPTDWAEQPAQEDGMDVDAPATDTEDSDPDAVDLGNRHPEDAMQIDAGSEEAHPVDLESSTPVSSNHAPDEMMVDLEVPAPRDGDAEVLSDNEVVVDLEASGQIPAAVEGITPADAAPPPATENAPPRRSKRRLSAGEPVPSATAASVFDADATQQGEQPEESEIVGPSAAAGARKKVEYSQTEIKARLEQSVATLIANRCVSVEASSRPSVSKHPSNLGDTQSDFLPLVSMQIEPDFGPLEASSVEAFISKLQLSRKKFLAVATDFINLFASFHATAWGSTLIRVFLELLETLSHLNVTFHQVWPDTLPSNGLFCVILICISFARAGGVDPSCGNRSLSRAYALPGCLASRECRSSGETY